MRDYDAFVCPQCQEYLKYDPQGQPCEKCEWWDEHARDEQAKYERMMWERQQWIEEYGRYE